MDIITPIYADTFNDITIASDNTVKLIVKKKPFKGLIRLLDHNDPDIVTSAIDSLGNIITAGADSTPENKPHPYYD
jgi:hypothetical protein